MAVVCRGPVSTRPAEKWTMPRDLRSQTGHRILPRVIATGFTAAFLGDERTLREFVVGDHVARRSRALGEVPVLSLFNDCYDPLSERQLRVGVDKDPELIRQFTPFCGRPISEIPDPYGCHGSYSDHFIEGLVERLKQLDIHPIVLDAYQAYQRGSYAPYVSTTLGSYRRIQELLSETCHDYTIRNLFHVQCPKCFRIDGTEIEQVEPGAVAYRCTRCGLDTRQDPGTLRGKLSWKLDCAARWNLYRIDTEVFSKDHLGEKGTLNVSRLVSLHFYGGHVPEIVSYGALRIGRDLCGRLLAMLPPAMFKELLTEHRTRDLHIGPEYLENFARLYEVRPGVSYVAFVREELPRRALEVGSSPDSQHSPSNPHTVAERALVERANRFSEFYYQRRHDLRLPDLGIIAGAPGTTLEAARDLLRYVLELRDGEEPRGGDLKVRIQSYLAGRPPAPALYPFVRRVFGQEDGPSLTTLLAILPREYLATVHLVLSGHARAEGTLGISNVDTERSEHRAA